MNKKIIFVCLLIFFVCALLLVSIKGKEIIDISDYQKKIIDPEMDSYRLLSPDGYNRMDYRIMTSFKHFEPLKR